MTRSRGAAIALSSLVAAGASAACGSDQRTPARATPIRSSPPIGTTHGPSGERATQASTLTLTSREVVKVRKGQYTAALVWYEDADFTAAVTAGVRDVFDELGVEVVAETSANFDPAKQKADIETVAAKRPSVMLTLPVDPVVTASAYRDVARQGTKIVLLSDVPRGMRHGRDYVSLLTDDLFQMGKRAADALAAAVGPDATVAYFFHDAHHFVTNERDRAFLRTITANYPSIEVVKVGIADPNQAQDQANAILVKDPNLAGAYVMFSQPAGDGVLAALRANGNTTTKLVSLDLDEPLALDMAKGGNTVALVADKAYELGRAMAKAAAYGLIGKKAPAFVVAPAMTVTRSNLAAAYRESLHRDPPESVLDALGR